MALDPTTAKAAKDAVAKLVRTFEFRQLLRVFRAEASGDKNWDELMDLTSQEFQSHVFKQTDEIRR